MDQGAPDDVGSDGADATPGWGIPVGPSASPGEQSALGVPGGADVPPDPAGLVESAAAEAGEVDDAAGPADPNAPVVLDEPVVLDAPDAAGRGADRRILAAGLVVAALLVAGLVVVVSGGDGSIRAEVAEPAGQTINSTVGVPQRTTLPVGTTTTEPSTTVASPVTDQPAVQTTTSTTAPAPVEAPPATAPALDDEPSVVARPAPIEQPDPAPEAPRAPWADSVFTTAGGHVSTDVGCASDTSAAGLDAFFAARVGPVLGWDYQHVYPLGANRFLWLFQDTFIDHSNTASTLNKASFAHNTAMVQEGNCFRLLHRGSTSQPTPFELGTGTRTLRTWFWPMGGELIDGKLHVFWARMRKDAVDPTPPDGLGWHPDATFVATYDPATMARLGFRQATQGGSVPIYGYAVQSDAEFTYLFANTFEQNLARHGGWLNGPHNGTEMWLGRVPRGQVFVQPEYWTSAGWIQDRRAAEPILQRHWAEFPFQPRMIDGQWVATTAVNGYWGDSFELDVADNPWGPWTTVESRPIAPRGGDPKMNTYHAHLMPWRDAQGQLVVSISNNARDMLRDAWPNPARYRLNVFSAVWRTPPPPTTTVPTTTTTLPPTTSSSSTTSTTAPETTTTSSTTSTTSSTTTSTSTTSTTSTSTTTTSSSTTSTTVPDTTTSSTTTSSTTTSSTSSTTTSTSTPSSSSSTTSSTSPTTTDAP